MKLSLLKSDSSLFAFLCFKLYENPENNRKSKHNFAFIPIRPQSLISTNFSSNQRCLARFLIP